MGDARVPWNKIVTVEDIDPSLLDSFSCGNEQMDNWFLTKALSWCYLGFCQVYIALGQDGIVGFFSLSPTSVRPVELTRSQRHGKNSMEHPGILLGRIAVREDVQKSGQRAGSLLLDEAIRRAFSIGKHIGGRFILLDAKTPELAKWYSRHGFLALKDSECRMILPMKDVPSLLGESDLL